MPLRIAFVAIESIYPATAGGKVRMAGLVEQMKAAGHEVEIFEPEHYGIDSNPTSLRHFLRPGPRQGHLRMVTGLAQAVQESGCDVAVVSISYLAHFLNFPGPVVVDFQNIECDRYRSIAASEHGVHRLTAALESAKARWWEPRVARRADLALACTDEEAAVLRAWGSRVKLVPHAADLTPVPLSASEPIVGYMASAGYGPNDLGGRWLISEVWPHVRAAMPAARLRVFGRRTAEEYAWVDDATIEIVGEVPDVADELARAAVVAGPVQSGGGAQLKVVTTLASARTMVVTPHTLLSVPPQARPHVSVAQAPTDFADALVGLLGDQGARHTREHALAGADFTWKAACAPLIDWLASDAE